MKVLEEAGIKTEVVAGTSIGALYGGAFAVGRTPQEMDEGIRTCPPFDVVSFFRHRLKIRHGNKLARRFYEALAGYNIEDLPVKFAATASDIVEMRHVVIDRGPIIDAIEASIAIPIIARPVAHQGRYLLDGGFWDRAPVDAAAELGADVVVSVELGHPLTLPIRFHEHGARFARLIERVSLQRTIAGLPFTVGAVSRPLVEGRTANVVIRPRVTRFGGVSPWHMAHCLDAGIEAAREALPAIQALLAGEAPLAVAEEYAPNKRLVTELGGAV
jgi:predicted acylesterase/phospholipase RssA